MSEGAPQNFEAKLARIETIVKELEGGRIELDRAIELFKEGKALARACELDLKGSQEQIAAAMHQPAIADEPDDERPPF